jgi:hypothetical protein
MQTHKYKIYKNNLGVIIMPRKYFFLVLLYVSLSFPLNAQQFVSRDSLILQYKAIEQKLLPSTFKLLRDTLYNSWGYYSWSLSYFLNDEIIMFQETKDSSYLEEFVKIADTMLTRRDDRIGLVDWHGKSEAGWSSRRRWNPKLNKNVNNGPPMRDLAEDACIVHPLLLFAKTIFKGGTKQPGLLITAKKYLKEAEEVMQVHINDEWDAKNNEFKFPKGSPIWADGINVPFNYEAEAGRNLLLLFQLTGNKKYLNICTIIARKLKKEMIKLDKCYLWHYWGGRGYNGWAVTDSISVNTPKSIGQNSYEDLSHGSIEVAFMLDCSEANLIFDYKDVQMLKNTFIKRIDKHTYLATDVYGTADSVNGKLFHGPFDWLRLAESDMGIFKTFYNLFYKNKKNSIDNYPSMLISYLIKYYPKYLIHQKF